MADANDTTPTYEELQDLVERIQQGDSADTTLAGLLADLHPADLADVVEELEPEESAIFLRTLSVEDAAEVLEYLDDEETTAIADQLGDEELVALLDEMASDDAADLLGDLDPVRAEALLAEMDEEDNVRSLLKYPEDTAGGIMVPVTFRLKDNMTAQAALDIIRENQPDPELIFYLFVEDSLDHLVGVCSIRRLVLAHPTALIRDIMDEDVVSVHVLTDQERCARLLTKYSLLALPVVNDSYNIVGIITVDDLVDVLDEEAEEDTLLLGGMSGESEAFDTTVGALRKRLPWLYVNLGTAFLASTIVSQFQGTIQQFAVLAVFQGIVAGQGGNAGTQTLTLMVRGLATGEITFRDALDLLRREALVGFLQGMAVGLGVAVVAYLWKGDAVIAIVLGVAMMGNMLMATSAGVLVPLLLERAGVDPAVASGVFVTAVTDICGFLFFLGLATAVLM